MFKKIPFTYRDLFVKMHANEMVDTVDQTHSGTITHLAHEQRYGLELMHCQEMVHQIFKGHVLVLAVSWPTSAILLAIQVVIQVVRVIDVSITVTDRTRVAHVKLELILAQQLVVNELERANADPQIHIIHRSGLDHYYSIVGINARLGLLQLQLLMLLNDLAKVDVVHLGHMRLEQLLLAAQHRVYAT